MPERLRRSVRTVGTAVLALGAIGAPAAMAAFGDNGVSAASAFGAASDWVAPEVGSTVIAKATGYLSGSIKQGGSYYVYATVIDAGNPASGITATTADVTAVTATGSSVALSAGSYSVGGASFTHRSAALSADNPLTAGSHTYAISSTDGAGNSRTQSGYSVTVDNTAPTAVDVQTTNKTGGTQGMAEKGDTVTFTFSEQIDPLSILQGWTGAPVNVVVRLIDGGCVLNLLVTVCEDDSFAVYDAANSSQLPLGSVDLNRSDYHGGIIGTATAITFGAAGTASTMVQSGPVVTITLGTASATATTAAGGGAMGWSPSTAGYDAAGNALEATAVTETGTSDGDF